MGMALEYSLRTLEKTDGQAMAELDRQSPDTGAVAFSTVYLRDPYESLMLLHPGAIGVVATVAERPGIVGMGIMSPGRCNFESKLLPFAYLFSITVHPEYRRRGIASRIYSWLIDTARDASGDETIIIAGIQSGNEGSLRTARSWSTSLEQRARTFMTPMRRRPYAGSRAYTVRRPEAVEWVEVARQQNAFYVGYDLYPPRTGAELMALHGNGDSVDCVREYLVAADSLNRPVAGLSLTDEGSIEQMRIEKLPSALRAANRLLGVFPANGAMRRLPIRDLWFAPGHERAVKVLWETVRWSWRDRADIMMTFVDPGSPLARLVPRSRFIPPGSGYVAIAAPSAPQEDRYLYHHS